MGTFLVIGLLLVTAGWGLGRLLLLVRHGRRMATGLASAIVAVDLAAIAVLMRPGADRLALGVWMSFHSPVLIALAAGLAASVIETRRCRRLRPGRAVLALAAAGAVTVLATQGLFRGAQLVIDAQG